ncbi:hypothetical protein ABZ816_15065 [Actinosynnema sp. NPDC047251]|uniref:Uncharacterized protein n=1 Tax=Saccharothrix espanaensis (strain ATCC 51144 / DSM 44229 / JCM 9112 / NBRC 15066 / NRRL 15764) TaxID=1179773 RepID=K0JQK7_SACES|nr:hypothetical protein [Saccharothrix espanaensis]CCH29660.1 hypothetical protein BN6_23420 [Saccharothrix espanaensis DSM 44229]
MDTEVEAGATRLRIQGELTDLLESSAALRTESGRQMLTDILGDLFEGPVHLNGSATRAQLLDLVRQCCHHHPAGLKWLVSALRVLDPYTPALDRLGELSDEWVAAKALPTRDWDRLREVLRSIRLAEGESAERRLLRELVRTSTVGKCEELPAGCRSTWTTFLYLANRNTSPNRLSPVMVFVAQLADRVADRAVAEELLRWNWRWAERFEVTDLMAADRRRPELAGHLRTDAVCLVFELDPDPVEPEKVTLSYWRHWAGSRWNGRREGDVEVALQDLEAEIDRVIAELEVDLGSAPEGVRSGSIMVEFVVPWEMVNLPIELWRKASLSADTVPLAVEHPVVMRSLERKRHSRFLLAWKQRWRTLVEHSSPLRSYWAHAYQDNDFTKMAVDLQEDDTVASLILSEPPGDRRGRAWREAAAAFRAGIPVLIWDRADCANPRFREAVNTVLADGALEDLPHRVAQLRRAALKAGPGEFPHAGHSFAVLWENASRLPEPRVRSWVPQEGSE